MLTALMLTLTLAATPAADRCAADLAHAEAAAVVAQRVAWEAWTPAEEALARQLVAAAVEQLRTARAACSTGKPSPFEANESVELVAKASPFEPTVDPFDVQDLTDADFAISDQMISEAAAGLAGSVRP